MKRDSVQISFADWLTEHGPQNRAYTVLDLNTGWDAALKYAIPPVLIVPPSLEETGLWQVRMIQPNGEWSRWFMIDAGRVTAWQKHYPPSVQIRQLLAHKGVIT